MVHLPYNTIESFYDNVAYHQKAIDIWSRVCDIQEPHTPNEKNIGTSHTMTDIHAIMDTRATNEMDPYYGSFLSYQRTSIDNYV